MNRTGRAPRFRTSALLKVHPQTVSNLAPLEIDNISVSGLLAYTNWKPQLGSTLRVSLDLAASVVECEMKVTRLQCTSGQGGERSAMGLCFSWLNHAARHALVKTLVALADQASQNQAASGEDVQEVDVPWQRKVPGVGVGNTFMTAQTACVVVETSEDRRALWQNSLVNGELFVATMRPPSVGAKLAVSVATENGGIELRGQVVDVVPRAHANRTGHPPGASLCLDLQGDQERLLRQLMLDRT